MKGIVFQLRRNLRLPAVRKPKISLKEYLSKKGVYLFFFLMFFIGLILGASYSKAADVTLLNRLDFLFTTNLQVRTELSSFEIFTSCFGVDFLFVLAVFLMGLSVWGSAALPFITAFKGFSVGLSSAFIFSLYRASGIGFYILVILPGTVMFLLSLIYYSKESFSLSLRYIRLSVFGSVKEPYLCRYIKTFMLKSLIALLFCAASALLDMFLWILFAGMFDF